LDEVMDSQPERLRDRIVHTGPNPEEVYAASQTSELVSEQIRKLLPTLRAPLPTPYGSDPTIYGTSQCTVYAARTNDFSAANRFIRLTLPMPNSIVALDPVSARMYSTGSTASGSYVPYAVGLRFLYNKAGTPNMNPGGAIPLDPGPGEIQLSMSIGYAPYDYNDMGHAEAKYAFNQLSKLFPNLDLQVDFEFAMMAAAQRKPDKSKVEWSRLGGPLHNCKAPVMLLS
jgi:hypothetical protein